MKIIMKELINIVGKDLSSETNRVISDVNGYLTNFISLVNIDNTNSYKFTNQFLKYIRYQNSANDFNIKLKSNSNLKHEIYVTIWRRKEYIVPVNEYNLSQIHIYFSINIFHNKGWNYRYNNIVVTDKNGEVLKDII